MTILYLCSVENGNHNMLTDDEFMSQFELTTFPAAWFIHEAHLRLAYLLIKKYGADEAAKKMTQQIKRFDEKFGDGTKFHHTITVAAVKTVAHFMNRSPESSFQELLARFPALMNNFKGLLQTHYSKEQLQDPKGKHEFVEPDLHAYDH